MVRPHSSAAGVLALLSEPEPVLKEHALKSLNTLVPQFWAEISEQIELMYVYCTHNNCCYFADSCFSESLYESEELSGEARNSAALLASKVYYYLGEYDEALSFALSAGSAFEAEGRIPGAEEYVETVICMYDPECCLHPELTPPSLQRRLLTATSRHALRRKLVERRLTLSCKASSRVFCTVALARGSTDRSVINRSTRFSY